MKKELFNPYKEMIIRCIDSCINYEQMQVCFDMMDRFKEQFTYHDARELQQAMDELSTNYLQKTAELGI
jgi:hypothetical protein